MPSLPNILRLLTRKTPPGPSAIAQILEFKAPSKFEQFFVDPLEYMQEYGSIVSLTTLIGPKCFLVTDPEAILYITKTNIDNFPKQSTLWNRIRLLLGNSSLGAEGGKNWQLKRKISQKGFSKTYLKNYAQQMQFVINVTSKRWERLARNKKIIDINNEMAFLALNIILKTLLNQTTTNKNLLLAKQTIEFGLTNLCHSNDIFMYPWVPTYANLKFHWLKKRLDSFLVDMLSNFEENPPVMPTAITEILKNKSEALIDKQFPIGELRVLLIAGYETTACALTWTWYLLAKNPQCTEKIYAELNKVLNSRTPTIEDLPNLPYLQAVYSEALRLYPSIPILNRKSIDEDTIQGYTIPKGSEILLHIYALHRNKHYWKDPLEFNPERFLDPNQPIHKPAYLPFGLGPRSCLGQSFAHIEIPLILANLAQKFKLRLKKNFTPKIQYGMSMHPHKLPMYIERR